ncbi:nucleotide exchange factor GrpE [bacterium]|nr:nucleotide exchange factor GrpE [bacterium]
MSDLENVINNKSNSSDLTQNVSSENILTTENSQNPQESSNQKKDFIDELKNIVQNIEQISELKSSFQKLEQIGEFKSNFQKLEDGVDKLLGAFESKIKYDQHKETIIDRLHSELQQFKSDFYRKLLQPIILDLIFFADQLDKNIPFLKDKSAEEIFKYLSDIPSEIRDILYRQGVESYQIESDIFNPTQQKIAKTEITNDSTLDKKISQRRSFGYNWEGRTIKPETVDIFVYKE